MRLPDGGCHFGVGLVIKLGEVVHLGVDLVLQQPVLLLFSEEGGLEVFEVASFDEELVDLGPTPGHYILDHRACYQSLLDGVGVDQ